MSKCMGDFGSTAPSGSNAVAELKTKVEELLGLQRRVDAGLAKMPSGPDKERLLKLRSESRGIFTKYVLPIYEKIKSAVSSAFGYEDDTTLGLVPLIGWAAVAVGGITASAALGYVAKSAYTESKILNDPSFTAAQKTQLLTSSGTGITKAVGDVKTIVIVAALVAGGFMLMRFMPSRRA